MQTLKPCDHRSVHSRIRHGRFTIPFRVHIIPIGFWRFHRLDVASVVDKTDDGTTIIWTVEFVMVLLIKIDRSGSLILEEHSLFPHDVHCIDTRKEHIPSDLSGAKFAHRSVHYRGCRCAPISAPDSGILSLEATLN